MPKYCYNLSVGGALSEVYPADPYLVEMRLSDQYCGIQLPSIIGNTNDFVMVDDKVVEVLKQHNIGDVEFWPFTLINHKGRVHSKDYCFVNPIGALDCLNYEQSEIFKDSNDVTIGVDRIVLDNEKLENAPDMFRIKDTYSFGFSEPLKEKLEREFTNFVFESAEQV